MDEAQIQEILRLEGGREVLENLIKDNENDIERARKRHEESGSIIKDCADITRRTNPVVADQILREHDQSLETFVSEIETKIARIRGALDRTQ